MSVVRNTRNKRSVLRRKSRKYKKKHRGGSAFDVGIQKIKVLLGTVDLLQTDIDEYVDFITTAYNSYDGPYALGYLVESLKEQSKAWSRVQNKEERRMHLHYNISHLIFNYFSLVVSLASAHCKLKLFRSRFSQSSLVLVLRRPFP